MYFTDDELKCPCCGVVKIDDGAITKLNKFRKIWGRPMHVNSAYRCMKRNKELGSEDTSKHPQGKAFDIRVNRNDRFEFVKLAIKIGFKGIGIADEFVHLDDREGPPFMWIY